MKVFETHQLCTPLQITHQLIQSIVTNEEALIHIKKSFETTSKNITESSHYANLLKIECDVYNHHSLFSELNLRKVMKYFAGKTKKTNVSLFLKVFREKFDLTKAEMLNFVNIAPRSEVELYLVSLIESLLFLIVDYRRM